MTDSPSIAGRYRLISRLGEGGMGVTYRAWDTRRAVPVVVKMPKQGSRAEGDALQRFAREIEAMLGLLHDHIVPILDHGEENGCPFVVMRFLPGGSLGDLRRRDVGGNPQTHPPGLLHNWLPTVASALDFIHDRGVLHRDVKPGNVFFDGFWNAFLGDFGIAKVLDDSGGMRKDHTLTDTRIAIGTPEYMAPETFLLEAAPDVRSDQYALAVTVYEMLAGRKPFTGSKAHIVVEHSTLSVPPLDSRGLKLPRSLCVAVEKALAKRREDRFQTCGEFAAAALRDVLPMPREPDVVRLLCPSANCSMILRLPTSAAGKEGKCPYCRSRLRIAADISALWIGGEEAATVSVPMPGGENKALVVSAASDLVGVVLPTLRSSDVSMMDSGEPWQDTVFIDLSGVAWPDKSFVGGYRVIAKLSTGSMGETYRAWDAGLGIPVVVKVPNLELRHDEKVMARFSREIRAMESMPHESIVPIIESGDHEGCPFVVMRFLPGGSLADYRYSRDTGEAKKNPPGMLHLWLPGIAAALDHIHSNGVLHRDVKPGNIFLDGFLKPYLGDFGIAKILEDSSESHKEQALTATRIAVGTLQYMAPELLQLRFKPDGRADQYALAVTVYEMLCGEKPFTGNEAFIPAEHLSSMVHSLATNCPALPLTAPNAIHKALSQKPENRFATCKEFAAAVLADINPMEPEVDTVRLLCPNCRNILKLSQRAAGKRGHCPRCQSVIDVAPDLGSLWLENEKWGTGPTNGLTTRSEEAAKALAKLNDYLELDSLTTLSDEAAKALAKLNDCLDLDSLTTLSDEAAKALARHEGLLFLNGLTALSDEAAKALVQHQGFMYLLGLNRVSDESVALMRRNTGISLPVKFRS